MAQPFFVCLLICSDGAYYVGHTDDLDRRLVQRGEGQCAFTSPRRPLRLAWYDEVQTRADARALEAQLTRWSREKKAALLRGDVATIRRLAKKRFPAPARSTPLATLAAARYSGHAGWVRGGRPAMEWCGAWPAPVRRVASRGYPLGRPTHRRMREE